jgi:GH15 family glucan-1,4-alpha-glucosidase
VRNWDYRYAWPRDATYTLDALLALGYHVRGPAERPSGSPIRQPRVAETRLRNLGGSDGTDALCPVEGDVLGRTRRACKLAEREFIPDGRARWRAVAGRIQAWIEKHGWDDDTGAYIRAPELRELDASILTLPIVEYEADRLRLNATVDAVRDRLGTGPLLFRYLGYDGVPGGQGAFTTCSFWLADALARLGRVEEAATLMDELIPLATDAGLFAEEIDPTTGQQLGNFPQGLVHLALINAAVSIREAEKAR